MNVFFKGKCSVLIKLMLHPNPLKGFNWKCFNTSIFLPFSSFNKTIWQRLPVLTCSPGSLSDFDANVTFCFIHPVSSVTRLCWLTVSRSTFPGSPFTLTCPCTCARTSVPPPLPATLRTHRGWHIQPYRVGLQAYTVPPALSMAHRLSFTP